jgi:peptidoglycan/xylan/chitin deacetylase (PgdA/CDA1 family)
MLKNQAAALLSKLPLHTALKLVGVWPGVLVLNYHRIGKSEGQPWDPKMWNVDIDEFDHQLMTLARCTEVISPPDVLSAMRAGRGRRVLITFDDGYRDNYELAFPLLRKHGLSATFFLATGFLDGSRASWWDEIAWMVHRASEGDGGRTALSDDVLPTNGTLLPPGISLEMADRDAAMAALTTRYKVLPDDEGERFLNELAEALGCRRCGTSDAECLWMTWEMARELHTAGMSIGGHTVSHPVLARLSGERQREEVTVCARRLREELGVEMRWFAYPVGDRDTFTPLTQEILSDCGVDLAFSFYGGVARPTQWDPFDVPRVHAGRTFPLLLLGTALGLPPILAG